MGQLATIHVYKILADDSGMIMWNLSFNELYHIFIFRQGSMYIELIWSPPNIAYIAPNCESC